MEKLHVKQRSTGKIAWRVLPEKVSVGKLHQLIWRWLHASSLQLGWVENSTSRTERPFSNPKKKTLLFFEAVNLAFKECHSISCSHGEFKIYHPCYPHIKSHVKPCVSLASLNAQEPFFFFFERKRTTQ